MVNKMHSRYVLTHILFACFLSWALETKAAVGFTSYAPSAIVYNSGDGKTVVCSTGFNGSLSQIVLMRYASTGALDSTFGTLGLVTTSLTGTNFNPTCLVISSGNIFVGGSAYDGSTTKFMIAKYTYSTGAIVGAFGSSGIATTTIPNNAMIQKLQVQSDGKILAIGTSNVNGYNYATIARYDQTTGALDTTYNSSGSQPGVATVSNYYFSVTSAVVDASNNLVIGGGDISTGPSLVYLTRYTSSGVLDGTFGTSGITTTAIGTNSQAKALTLDGSGKILVGGDSDSQFFAARYTSSGALDTSFNTTGYNVTAMGTNDNVAQVILTGTNVLLAGSTRISDLNNFGLAQFTSAGALDVTFNTTGKVTTAFCNAQGLFDGIIDASSRIYGLASLKGSILLVRYTSAGAVDTAFGQNGLANLPYPCCNLSSDNGGLSSSYIYAFDSASQSLTTANIFQVVQFRDNGGLPLASPDWTFDSATNSFIIGQPGMYWVTGMINPTIVDAGNASLIVTLNGTEISGSQLGSTSQVYASLIVSLNISDAIQFKWTSTSNSNTLNLVGTSSLTPTVKRSASAVIMKVG